MTTTDVNPEMLDKFQRMLGFWEYDPANIDLIERTVMLGVELQQWQKVDLLLTDASERGVHSPQLTASRATLALRAGELETARQLYSDAIESGLSDDGVRYNLAFCHYLCGDYSRAGVLLNLGDYGSYHREVSILAARCHYQLNDIPKAKNIINACQDCTGNVEAEALKALLIYDSGDLKSALDVADTVLSKGGEVSPPMEALLAKGGALTDLRRYDEAKPLFEVVTREYPKVGRGWYGLALLQFNDLNVNGALESITRALQTLGDHLGSWHLKAWCYIYRSELDNALAAFNAAYKLDRGFAETHGGLAAVYALKGEVASAKKHIKLARKLNAGGMATIYAEMVLLNAEGKQTDAKQLFDTAKSTQNEQLGILPEILINERLEALSRVDKQNEPGENDVGS